MSTDDDEIDVNVADILEDTEEPETMDILESEVVDMDDPEESEVVESDPHEFAIKALESQIKSEILVLETKLKTERVALSKVKDRVSESGKNGYFIVQAKVAEFQKVKVVEQKSRVTRNKREFVMKMLPVVDAFRAAPLVSPSSTEREISMHKSFGSLLESILVVFEKYGFSEYDAGNLISFFWIRYGTAHTIDNIIRSVKLIRNPHHDVIRTEIGGVLAPARHQVSEIIDGEVGGVVASQSRRGMVDKDGEVVR